MHNVYAGNVCKFLVNVAFESCIHYCRSQSRQYLFLDCNNLVCINAWDFDLLSLDIIVKFVLVHKIYANDFVIAWVNNVYVVGKRLAFYLQINFVNV